jgi:hypothetical protein
MIGARLIAIALLFGSVLAYADSKPVASSKVKAYKGAEGEVVAVLEVNSSKQVLVFFKKVSSALDGTSRLYEYEDKGNDNKEIYWNKKQGSKTQRAFVLTEYEHGSWLFINPIKTSENYRVAFSESETQAIKVDDVLAGYKP